MRLSSVNRLIVAALSGGLAFAAFLVSWAGWEDKLARWSGGPFPNQPDGLSTLLTVPAIVLLGLLVYGLLDLVVLGHPAESRSESEGGPMRGLAPVRSIERYWKDKCEKVAKKLEPDFEASPRDGGLDLRTWAVGYAFAHCGSDFWNYVIPNYVMYLLMRDFSAVLGLLTLSLTLSTAGTTGCLAGVAVLVGGSLMTILLHLAGQAEDTWIQITIYRAVVHTDTKSPQVRAPHSA